MSIFIISLGLVAFAICFIWQAYIVAEYARKKTEKSIAVFYRDEPMECTMFLNRLSLEETKKEIARTKASLENE